MSSIKTLSGHEGSKGIRVTTEFDVYVEEGEEEEEEDEEDDDDEEEVDDRTELSIDI